MDVQPHFVSVLTWPEHKGMVGGCLGLTTDSLLIGRLDGTLAYIDVFDSSSFKRHELDHCYRVNGTRSTQCFFFFTCFSNILLWGLILHLIYTEN